MTQKMWSKIGRKKPREETQNDDVGKDENKVARERPKKSRKLSGTSDNTGCYPETETRANVGKNGRVRFWNAKKVDTNREI